MPSPPPETVAAREAVAAAEKELAELLAMLADPEKQFAEFEADFRHKRRKLRVRGDDAGVATLTRERDELQERVATIKEDIAGAESDLAEAKQALRRLENAEQIKRDCRRVKRYMATIAKLGDLIEHQLTPLWREIWAVREEVEATWPTGMRGLGYPPHVDSALVRPDDIMAAVKAGLYRAMGKQFVGAGSTVHDGVVVSNLFRQWSANRTYSNGEDARDKTPDEVIDTDGMVYACLSPENKGNHPKDSRYWRSTGVSVHPAQSPTFPGAKPRKLLDLDPKRSWSLREAADHACAYLCATLEGKPWPQETTNEPPAA